MRKKIVSFALSEDSISKVDDASRALGLSKSEYIDLMIKKGFHFPEEVAEITKRQKELRNKIVDGGSK